MADFPLEDFVSWVLLGRTVPLLAKKQKVWLPTMNAAVQKIQLTKKLNPSTTSSNGGAGGGGYGGGGGRNNKKKGGRNGGGGQRQQQQQQQHQHGSVTCFKCKKKGHKIADCPN